MLIKLEILVQNKKVHFDVSMRSQFCVILIRQHLSACHTCAVMF